MIASACPGAGAFRRSALLDQLGYKSGPPSLVTCSNPCAVITMKVFMELNEVAPVGIALKFVQTAVNGPAPRVISQENSDKPAREIGCYFPEIRQMSGPIRALGLDVASKEVMKLL
jgi:hypothetical protein